MPKTVAVGVVTSDRAVKTRRVEVARLVKHPKYKKYVRRRTICHVHDENNDSKMGDTVEIVECRPRSKSKRWELVRVVQASRAVDLAALRAASKPEEATGETPEPEKNE
ncbi:MAG: 30S ribosomal protein S17 [Pirellulales bacterium]|jgi:small subunit ribosomal protein S17